MIILPRYSRNKRREKSQERPFLQVKCKGLWKMVWRLHLERRRQWETAMSKRRRSRRRSTWRAIW